MSMTLSLSDAAATDCTGVERDDLATRVTSVPEVPNLTMVVESLPENDPAHMGEALERLVQAWVRLAHSHWRARHVDYGVWVADVVGLDGAWADGPTKAVAVQNLESVIYEWVTMKLADGDQDIPPMDGLSLVVPTE